MSQAHGPQTPMELFMQEQVDNGLRRDCSSDNLLRVGAALTAIAQHAIREGDKDLAETAVMGTFDVLWAAIGASPDEDMPTGVLGEGADLAALYFDIR